MKFRHPTDREILDMARRGEHDLSANILRELVRKYPENIARLRIQELHERGLLRAANWMGGIDYERPHLTEIAKVAGPLRNVATGGRE